MKIGKNEKDPSGLERKVVNVMAVAHIIDLQVCLQFSKLGKNLNSHKAVTWVTVWFKPKPTLAGDFYESTRTGKHLLQCIFRHDPVMNRDGGGYSFSLLWAIRFDRPLEEDILLPSMSNLDNSSNALHKIDRPFLCQINRSWNQLKWYRPVCLIISFETERKRLICAELV